MPSTTSIHTTSGELVGSIEYTFLSSSDFPAVIRTESRVEINVARILLCESISVSVIEGEHLDLVLCIGVHCLIVVCGEICICM